MNAQDCDLAARVARLDIMARHCRVRELASEIDSIRIAADSAGLLPVGAVARALERALARGDSGPVLTGWISVLADAVRCGRGDSTSGEVLLAAGAVRLAG